jgi:hypothetical protein
VVDLDVDPGALLHWVMVACEGESGGMRRSHARPLPAISSSAFAGFGFPPEVIVLAVRWYLRFGLWYRDIEVLVERGIEVDHVTVDRWVQRFPPLLADGARPCRHAVGDRWFVDQTYVKVAAGGGTSIGRSTNMARSSTCTSRHDAIPGRRDGSFRRR